MATTSILNSFAASGADATLVAGKLNVAITSSTGTGSFPTMDYEKIKSVSISPAITETLYSTRIGWTAADSTSYTLTITQKVGDEVITRSAYIENSGIGATNTTIGTAIAACFTDTPLKVSVVYVAANAYVTVTTLTGYQTPTIGLGTTGSMTNTSQMAGVAIASCVATTASGTPAVINSTAHGLVNGNKITIASDDNTRLASGTYIVQYLSANTYSLYDLNGNPLSCFTSATVTATVVKVAGPSVGSGTDLAAAGVTGVTAGVGYAKYVFNYSKPLAGLNMMPENDKGYQHVLYAKQWATTTTTSYTTNVQSFITRMNEHISNYNSGGTVASHTSNAESASIAQVAVIV